MKDFMKQQFSPSRISLVANSGLQFHKFNVTIDPSEKVMRPMNFRENIDLVAGLVSLEYATYIPNHGIYVSKGSLKEEGYLDEKGQLNTQDFNPAAVNVLDEEFQVFSINNIKRCLRDKFEGSWIPIPFFRKYKNGSFFPGPLAWCRMMIKRLERKTESGDTHTIILIFDTQTLKEQDVYFAPTKRDTLLGNNLFGLSTDDDLNLNFCSEQYNGGWVETYLTSLLQQDKKESTFYLQHIAEYLYLIKYLGRRRLLPEIEFLSEDGPSIDVDLVIDVGNSHTCGILFEHPIDKKNFEFKSAKLIHLQDLSRPNLDYQKPFSTRVTFAEQSFGYIKIPKHPHCFRWPSPLRIGPEAIRLANQHNHWAEDSIGGEVTHSSPKRFLWDKTISSEAWKFVSQDFRSLPREVYVEGISEQFQEDGRLAQGDDFGIVPKYSRKTLMTFVYLELFLHTLSQINSFVFRSQHGNVGRPRKLRRIVITSPTSIPQGEQVALRQEANQALEVLQNYFRESPVAFDSPLWEFDSIQIIPSVKDLRKNLDALDERIDWIYDEATCAQLVFLFGQLSIRFLNNYKAFFEINGKTSPSLGDKDTHSLTIGSLDIGGGTTDLMICNYTYDANQDNAQIVAKPMFWETFGLAGDDLLRNIVQEIVIEDTREVSTEGYQNGQRCFGVIENYARSLNAPKVSDGLNQLFGVDSNRQDAELRRLRKNLVLQFAIPIAERYLQHALENRENVEVGFHDLFDRNAPHPNLVQSVNDYFSKFTSQPFRLEDIRWTLSQERVHEIVEKTFDQLLAHIAILLHAHDCDFVLLAGKPSTLAKVREMVIGFLPVAPNRIITLNEYWVGRWYPFSNDQGYFETPKTIVAVGALIALLAGRSNELQGFNIETNYLKTKLVSTADFLGPYNLHTGDLESVFLDPETSEKDIFFTGASIVIGYRQLPFHDCEGRPLYILRYNQKYFQKKWELLDSKGSGTDFKMFVQNEIVKLNQRAPFFVTLERDISVSKEHVAISMIEDREQNPVSTMLLTLDLCSLPNEGGFWMDTGAFILDIKTKKQAQ